MLNIELIVYIFISITELYTGYASIRWMRKDSKKNRKYFSYGQFLCMISYAVAVFIFLIIEIVMRYPYAILDLILNAAIGIFYYYTWKKS